MIDQLVGLLLLGLGVKTTPFSSQPAVKGDKTEVAQAVDSTTTTNDTNTTGTKMDTRPRILPVLTKPVGLFFESRTATRPGDAINKIRREEIKEVHEDLIKSRKDFMETLKEKRKDAHEEFKTKQEEFQQKLAGIRDERKKALVEKLSVRCQEINKKRTDAMTGMLTKLSSILENITNRATTAEAAGKDMASVNTAVATAQTAIENAQTAVANQAGKECVITINSEKTLRADVGATISALEKDIKLAHDAVVAARKAVGDAVKALGLVLGESLTEKLRPTVTPTTTQ